MTLDAVDPVEVDRVLQLLAPRGVITGCRPIDARDAALLFPIEIAAVERAVSRRRSEFATGRALLRQLIGRDVAIPVGANRAPQLPAGVVGSLAHDSHLAVAAVSQLPAVTAIGIDVEPAVALAADVASAVLRPDEHGLDAHLVFTLKEAVYKAWSAGGGRMLDHHDVRVTIGGDRFSGEVVQDASRFNGRYGSASGRWLALVVVSINSF